MYIYDEIDQRLVDERVRQFRGQTERFLAGKLSEEEFRALRLRNGLYIQRYAPMLRIAIPYGLLSTRQLRKLAEITRRYDRGYGHFSTRQNMQLNWPKLEETPDILAELATVQMHAIQTSGNSFRNITTDHFAGVAQDEIVDSFGWCEVIREWSTFHPEFSYLPRKFKIAVNGARSDRAAVAVHDIGLHAVKDAKGEVGFKVLVRGGLGRTPMIGFVIREFLPWPHLLTYIEAILRVYNRYGRRDNIHKARIKILVKERGPEKFREEVEAEWAHLKDGPSTLVAEEIARIESRFTRPSYAKLPTPNLGLLTNIICCPGGDFCSLANAKSIPVAEAIQQRFDDLDYLHDIGELDLNISGCMNACGHHHVGHIGVLGVDKSGEEWYQIEVGGNQGEVRPGRGASLGKVIGPSFARAEVPDVIDKLIECYLARRDSEAERFIDVVHRIGVEPFKESVYGNADQRAAHRRGQLASA